MALSEADRNEMGRLRRKGWPIAKIAAKFGISQSWCSRVLDPTMLRRHRDKERESRKATHTARAYRMLVESGPRPSPGDVRARQAEIPKYDTRSLTGVLMGDPIPGRGASA